ncbi:uncharacterized protein LOC110448927 [Mizuhopecten yessoensis]|uniref:uncharacterized protein LOC110448927 n=1 Tax=Mizuhopecten yessoensis TaxID=6573 RepID=UPI000B45985A|nr:uncharacterized protein LOC110448927 [Mizuhopecten yessoensis]
MSYRVCAISACKNNGYKLKQWNKEFCVEHQCKKKCCICQQPFKLFPFPTAKKDLSSRLIWARVVQRKCGSKIWQPKEDSRICSEHFIDGEPTTKNPYPSLKLGYQQVSEIKARIPPKESPFSFEPTCTPKKKLKSVDILSSATTGLAEQYAPAAGAEPENLDNLKVANDFLSDHDYTCIEKCQGCTDKSAHICKLQQKNRTLESENLKLKEVLYQKCKKPFSVDKILRSNKQTKFYTGFPTIAAFLAIFTYITTYVKNIQYWKGPSRVCNPLRKQAKKYKRRILTTKEEIVMTLMKIRLGLLNVDLADRFGVSTTHVSHVITTWIRVLSQVLGSLVINPKPDIVQANLPPSFKNPKYKRVRHIIDCTEVFLEKPSSFELQSVTWSDYKHHHTAKILLSITPAGMINFISKSWGGRASDKHVTLNSGFLEIIQPYDVVMADRGFPIREDLALFNVELLVPPGRRGVSQMTTSDVQTTKQIANRRIYVEQAIRRLKSFRILKYELPLTLVHHLDDICLIAAGICNLYPPLPRYK